jgi:hypothetical protein
MKKLLELFAVDLPERLIELIGLIGLKADLMNLTVRLIES